MSDQGELDLTGASDPAPPPPEAPAAAPEAPAAAPEAPAAAPEAAAPAPAPTAAEDHQNWDASDWSSDHTESWDDASSSSIELDPADMCSCAQDIRSGSRELGDVAAQLSPPPDDLPAHMQQDVGQTLSQVRQQLEQFAYEMGSDASGLDVRSSAVAQPDSAPLTSIGSAAFGPASFDAGGQDIFDRATTDEPQGAPEWMPAPTDGGQDIFDLATTEQPQDSPAWTPAPSAGSDLFALAPFESPSPAAAQPDLIDSIMSLPDQRQNGFELPVDSNVLSAIYSAPTVNDWLTAPDDATFEPSNSLRTSWDLVFADGTREARG